MEREKALRSLASPSLSCVSTTQQASACSPFNLIAGPASPGVAVRVRPGRADPDTRSRAST